MKTRSTSRLALCVVIECLVILALVPPAVAGHQNDAGSGQDAPNTMGAAMPVSASAWTGRLDASEGDYDDWYSVGVPSGKGIRVTGASPRPIRFDVRALSGGALETFSTTVNKAGSVELVPPGGGILLRVGFGGFNNNPTYSVQVHFFDVADLRIGRLDVYAKDTPTAVGDAPSGKDHDVLVRVENVGAAMATEAPFVLAARHATSERVLARAAITLGPGESIVLHVPWDGTGEIGDVVVHASVSPVHDLDWSNNEAEAEVHVIAGGAGLGLDAFNHHVTPQASVLVASAGVYHDEGTMGASVDVRVASSVYVVTAAWLDADGRPQAFSCTISRCVGPL